MRSIRIFFRFFLIKKVKSFKFEQQQSELCKSCGYYYHKNHLKCYLQIIQMVKCIIDGY